MKKKASLKLFQKLLLSEKSYTKIFENRDQIGRFLKNHNFSKLTSEEVEHQNSPVISKGVESLI